MSTDDSEQVVLICAALGLAVATAHKRKLMAEARVRREMGATLPQYSQPGVVLGTVGPMSTKPRKVTRMRLTSAQTYSRLAASCLL